MAKNFAKLKNQDMVPQRVPISLHPAPEVTSPNPKAGPPLRMFPNIQTCITYVQNIKGWRKFNRNKRPKGDHLNSKSLIMLYNGHICIESHKSGQACLKSRKSKFLALHSWGDPYCFILDMQLFLCSLGHRGYCILGLSTLQLGEGNSFYF